MTRLKLKDLISQAITESHEIKIPDESIEIESICIMIDDEIVDEFINDDGGSR